MRAQNVFEPTGSFTGHQDHAQKSQKTKLMFELLIIFSVSLVISIITGFILQPPYETEMEKGEHYLAVARNLFINIAAYAATGMTVWLLVNFFKVIVFQGSLLNTTDFDRFCWLISIVVATWSLKESFQVTPSNSILRSINIFWPSRRNLPEDQGEVDNARKYRGSTFTILSILERWAGIVETESRDNLPIKIPQLTFVDDIGSCDGVLSFRIVDADAYFANGDTPEQRIRKVQETLLANLKSIIEAKTSGRKIRKVMAGLSEFSEGISIDFRNKSRPIEVRLGIDVQYIELTELNESDARKKAVSAQKTLEMLTAKAQEMVDASGGRLLFDEAMQHVQATINPDNTNQSQVFHNIKGLPRGIRSFIMGMGGEHDSGGH